MAQIKYNLGDLGTDKYSTDEIKIGEWINGKPLYRKVVVIDNPYHGMTFSIDNIDEPINASWTQAYDSKAIIFSYGESGSLHSDVSFNLASKNFVISMKGGFAGKMVAIVEYTKTND